MTRVSFPRPLALVLLIAWSFPAQAESPAALIADGQPWVSTMPNGRTVSLTFFPDGTARMQMGSRTRDMNWQPTKDGICLSGGPGGQRCLRLEPTTDGFVGYDGEDPSITLSR